MLKQRQSSGGRHRQPVGGIAAAILVLFILLPGNLSGAMAQTANRLAYNLDIVGLEDGGAQKLFEELSTLRQQRSSPPRSFSELRYVIRRDVDTLTRILRSRGYYGSRVSYQLDRSQRPFPLRLLVNQGPQFKIAVFDVTFSETDVDVAKLQAQIEPFLPAAGSPAVADRVVQAQRGMLARLPEIGHPHVRVGGEDIVVDHETGTMNVDFDIAAGPEVRFGPPVFSGAPSVKDSFLSKLTPWDQGELYDSRKVEEMRLALAETNLFTSIDMDVGEIGADGAAPLEVQLSESQHRTYGVGASYDSDDGFGVNASWEHRNFFRGGERFFIEGRVAEIEQSLLTRLDVPAFLRRDQRLLLDLRLAHEEPDAYTRWGADTSAVVEREINPVWTVRAGATLEYARIEDLVGVRHFLLAGGLAGVERDTTDDIFDPTRGSRILYSLRPFIGRQDGLLRFLINEAAGSVYFSLDAESRYVAAARLRIGSITGASLQRLPANRRFYAGGGASVRGYRYQFAGPITDDGTPLGGRSLIEAGLEMRVRVTETIGVVPFVEAGKVDDSSLPDLNGEIFWGAGLGLRYYTGFAPIRLDVAIPLNKREFDNGYQIYISLGQSF